MRGFWIGVSIAVLALTGSGTALADQALAQKSGCNECHASNKALNGPAFAAIAARYKGQAGAREALFEKVKYGSRGNWVAVSKGALMPAQWGILSDAQIRGLVDWILAL